MELRKMPRGVRVIELTDVERDALNAMGELILHCNRVEPWAPQAEGFPFYFADQCLRAALTDLFGKTMAEEIRDIFYDSGESVVYSIDYRFSH